MKVFIAGAAGALGLPLVRHLVYAGHSITGLTRSSSKRGLLEAAGATAVIGDALDRDALLRAVQEAQPTHVVNLLTALPAAGPVRPKELRATNKLRIEGSANLLEAAIAAGAKRVVAESFVSVIGEPAVRRPVREEQALPEIALNDPTRDIVLALRTLEQLHADARAQGKIETVVLRYGLFYGPGVPSTEDMLGRLAAGKMYAPKQVTGVASWIHIEDAATATAAALEHPDPGPLYNIADDEPLPLDIAVAEAARAVHARPPRRVPRWLLRWAAPLIEGMTSAYLALDNTKARRELSWRPAFPNIRVGFSDLAARSRRAA